MDSDAVTRWLSAALGAGVIAFVAAFVPSPGRLLAAFDKPAALEVSKPPRLAMRELGLVTRFSDIEARPLFNEGRKADPAGRAPVAAGAQPVQHGGGELSSYRLVGIVTDNVTQRAIVEGAGGSILRVGPGDRLGDWRVEKIDQGGVTVRKDSQSVRIVMKKR